MVDVAFVCLGNICRSPMAEAIMRQRLIDRNISGVNVYSKGTGKWNLGEPPHEGTQDILNRHNIPFDGMISELFESSDDFDYIIAMDQSNVDNIQNINPNIKGNCSNCSNLVTWKRVMCQILITLIILKVYMKWYNHLVTI